MSNLNAKEYTRVRCGELRAVICPECGKEFVPAPYHVYRNKKRQRVCTYSCTLKNKKEGTTK